MRQLIATILLCAAYTSANAVVVTFDGVEQPNYQNEDGSWNWDAPTHVTTQGFSFGYPTTSNGNGGYGVAVGSSITAYAQGDRASFRVWRDDGQLFDLQSMDLRTRSTVEFAADAPASDRYYYRSASEVIAYAADNSIIASWSSDALNTQVFDWYTIGFDDEWTDIAYLRIQTPDEGDPTISYFSGDGITLDNFNATVVPVPAAVWLFISGLSVLGFRRRLR